MKKKILFFISINVFCMPFLNKSINVNAINISIINADNILHKGNELICEGNVLITYSNKVISANKIVYNQESKFIEASSNVIIKDEQNNTYLTDYIKVNTDFNSGIANNIKIINSDKSRLSAREAIFQEKKILLKDATYSPCYNCINDSEDLTWQIFAKKISFDPNGDVIYTDTLLETFGKVVLAVPQISHVGPNIKRKSGFLTPKISYSKNSGFNINIPYLFAVSDFQDIILKPFMSSKYGAVAWGSYEHRFYNGMFFFDTSYTGMKSISQSQLNSTIPEIRDVAKNIQSTGYRGHFFSKLRYDINELWRLSSDINLLSDMYYFKKFPFFEKVDRTIESNVKLERFKDRNYTSIKGATYQNIEVNDLPVILPMIEHNMSFDMYYGTIDFDTQITNFIFNSSRNAQKIISNISWSKQHVMPYGLLFENKAVISLNMLKVYEKTNTAYDSYANLIPQLNTTIKLPLLCMINSANSAVVSPVMGIVISHNKIMNDIYEDPFNELSTKNIYSGNRSSSIYNIDDGSRFYYGINLSFYKQNVNYAHLQIARSRELTINKSILKTTGLNAKYSNIVISGDFIFNNDLTFVLDSSYNAHKKRMDKLEIGAVYDNKNYGIELFKFRGKHFDNNPFDITVQNNQNVRADIIKQYDGIDCNIYKFLTSRTKLYTGVTFGDNNSNIMKYCLGVNYKNECTILDASIERSNFNIGDLKPDTSLKIIIHLKNLSF